VSVAARIEKLRAMADPARNDNKHEREVARTELERLQRAHPQATARPPLSWIDVGRAPDMETFASRFAEMRRRDEERMAQAIGPDAFAKYQRHMDEWRAKRAWHDEERRKWHHHWRLDADAKRWMASLKVGAEVRTLHDIGAYNGPALASEILTVARRTPSGIVVMTDGSKWNANGYKRGETGRDGLRTFLAPLEGIR